jgi:hypothetical protein
MRSRDGIAAALIRDRMRTEYRTTTGARTMMMRRETPERETKRARRALRLVKRDLDRLTQVDPNALREEADQETQSILDTLAGKTIRSARVEARRVVLETTDGNRYFFCGLTAGV